MNADLSVLYKRGHRMLVATGQRSAYLEMDGWTETDDGIEPEPVDQPTAEPEPKPDSV